MSGATLAVDVQVNVGAPREPYLHSAIFLVGARRRCRERDRADAIPPLLRIVINKVSHLTGSGVHPNRLGRLRSIAPTCPWGVTGSRKSICLSALGRYPRCGGTRIACEPGSGHGCLYKLTGSLFQLPAEHVPQWVNYRLSITNYRLSAFTR